MEVCFIYIAQGFNTVVAWQDGRKKTQNTSERFILYNQA